MSGTGHGFLRAGGMLFEFTASSSSSSSLIVNLTFEGGFCVCLMPPMLTGLLWFALDGWLLSWESSGVLAMLSTILKSIH